jgi:cytochrome c556
MLRTVVVVGSLLLGTSVVVAQQNVVAQTQTLMKNSGKSLGGVLGAMVKGDKPYDQAAVDGALSQLSDLAKKLPDQFPDSVKGIETDGDYSASPKIWTNRSEFNAQIASFTKAVSDATGKVKDLDSLKVTLPTIAKQCGNCHEGFRVKNL